jgi:hypothetical protein
VNGFDYGLTRNCGGTTTATRFDTDASVDHWDGNIVRTAGAQLSLNKQFLNDARWRKEMCTEAGVTRGFCATSMGIGDYVASKIGLASCAHVSDEDCDGCVRQDELFAYIADWREGQATLAQLMASIQLWKEGC